jgi:hypothetical protein
VASVSALEPASIQTPTVAVWAWECDSVATVRPFERVVVWVTGERLVAVANVLSGRFCQKEFSKLGGSVRDYLELTALLEAVLSERVKDTERVLETMEDFGKRVCVWTETRARVGRNGNSDPRNSPNDFPTPRQRLPANFRIPVQAEKKEQRANNCWEGWGKSREYYRAQVSRSEAEEKKARLGAQISYLHVCHSFPQFR